MSESAVLGPEGGELMDIEKRERLIRLVVDSVASGHSKRAYRTGLEQFFAWWERDASGLPFSRALVQRYCSDLGSQAKAASTINQRLAPLRKLAEEAAAAALLPAAVASGVRQLKGAKQLSVGTGNWLTREQAECLLALPDRQTLKGKRDQALLSLLLGAGLRREELAQLRIEDMREREGRWCLVDLAGTGNRLRTVAIPDWAKQAADEWIAAMPFSTGLLLGKINKGGRYVGQGMAATSIYGVVSEYAEKLSITLKPHDLRRTYGKLAHQGGAKIEQIQFSYGHASLTTTERYLGIAQDLRDAPCDHLGLSGQRGKTPERDDA
jgi:integrase/recombinase XerD